MSSNIFTPTEILSPFVKRYIITESDDNVINRILPDTSIAVAFRFKGQLNHVIDQTVTQLPSSVISGLRKSARLVNYAKGSSALIVLFKETGAKAFFKHPLHEIFEQSIALDNLIQRQELVDIEERLGESVSNNQRIGIIEEFLIRLLYSEENDKLISAAVQKIESSKGNIKMKDLANSFYLSHDAFEKRFRKTVGTTPKQFSSIIRMKAVIQSVRRNQTFTGVAYDAGFFDQAHFNKEFKIFTGQPPTEFFKSPPLW